MRTIHALPAGAVAVALVALTAGCGGSGTPAQTTTVTTTAALSRNCKDALTAADKLVQSYATYLGMTGTLFQAVSQSDWESVNAQAPGIETHMTDSVAVAKDYAAKRDACYAGGGTTS